MDDDDERILDLEFEDDDLESMGYERPVPGTLVLYNRDQQQGNEGDSVGALFRPENQKEGVQPAPRMDLAPRHEADPVHGGEPKALLNTGNLNINISVNSEGTRLRRGASPPLLVGARAIRAEDNGDGGPENGLPPHARPNRAGLLLYFACTIFLAAICVFVLLRAGGHGHRHGPVQLSPAPADEAFHVTPGAFSEAHDSLKQDFAQFEELFYRARSALPPASSTRQILEDGPQPQALRGEVELLGGLHDRLVGNVLESDIARGLRVSNVQLRAATAEAEGKQGLWGLRSPGQFLGTVRAERAHAKDMIATVATMMNEIDAVRERTARMCGRQPYMDTHGSWTLSEDSTCPKEDNYWELKGGSSMSLGNGLLDAQAAFGLINWICGDLDALTATGTTSQASASIAVEARRMLERWEQLIRDWDDLEAIVVAK